MVYPRLGRSITLQALDGTRRFQEGTGSAGRQVNDHAGANLVSAGDASID